MAAEPGGEGDGDGFGLWLFRRVKDEPEPKKDDVPSSGGSGRSFLRKSRDLNVETKHDQIQDDGDRQKR